MEFIAIAAVVIVSALCIGAFLKSFDINANVTIGNTSGTARRTVTGEADHGANPTVNAALPGTLTVHTDNTTGSLTMEAGHGLTTGARVDVFWTNTDGSFGKRYGAILGTVAGTVCPITSSEGGDNLPAAGTSVLVCLVNAVTLNFLGDNLKGLLAVTAASEGYVVISGGGTTHLAVYVTPTSAYFWDSEGGLANPIVGDTVDTVYFSSRNVTANSDLSMAYVTA
jgi:hypothetical protein